MNETTQGAVSAVLFASSQPVSPEKLAGFLDVSVGEVKKALENIDKTLSSPDSGVKLECKEGNYFLVTKTEYGQTVAAYLDRKRTSFLSNAAMETLAVAAYHQPVTKAYISQVRGVASGEIVESLVDKRLLEENGRLDLPGRPMSYVTTERFLTVFGLDSLDDLPEQSERAPEDGSGIQLSLTEE